MEEYLQLKTIPLPLSDVFRWRIFLLHYERLAILERLIDHSCRVLKKTKKIIDPLVSLKSYRRTFKYHEKYMAIFRHIGIYVSETCLNTCFLYLVLAFLLFLMQQ